MLGFFGVAVCSKGQWLSYNWLAWLAAARKPVRLTRLQSLLLDLLYPGQQFCIHNFGNAFCIEVIGMPDLTKTWLKVFATSVFCNIILLLCNVESIMLVVYYIKL